MAQQRVYVGPPQPPERSTTTEGPASSRGRDLTMELTLLRDDAIRGGVIRMQVPYPGSCTVCRGSGRHHEVPRSRPCPGCAGSGEMEGTATRVQPRPVAASVQHVANTRLV
jgi:DnaJ-class molecular chaperone